MMHINYWAVFTAALIPLMLGFLWYHPKVFGKIWMQEVGLTDAQMKGAMAGVFVFTVILSFLMGFFLQYVTIHQFGAVGMIGGDEMNANPSYHAFMKDYGTAYRSLGHGALHSLMAGVLFVFPIMAINAMFERKSWKYTMINTGYWTLCITIMGGIICGWHDVKHFYW
ncbi:hypothetical protein QE422_001169 [Chryseobacterium sp. SORGH_AS 447]|uniref:DUF1761 domain-containing protein n=1 Tax=Chryseobacterium sp. SORGH_AS_0447 TaxID=3041769 RepID=UPI00277E07C8|nr:DUF1761 domain-containing protein [Chryseobacterium sp. SORGH_AS_0447]MDQ1160801.1 hypothetical protein [Chryseobacterium sp. SORGH_AS_0447]